MGKVGIDAMSGTTGPAPRLPAGPAKPPPMNSNDINSYQIPGLRPGGVDPAGPSPYQQFMKTWQNYVATPEQIQGAAQQIMPMYQARLGGLQGPVAEAMRTRGLEQIQAQYGTALRSAMNQAGAQGIRGPAAVAMQQDIRDQMGRATAGYQRDLTIADWDAKRQALADYYNTMAGERGIRIGTRLAMQELQNTQTGYSQYRSQSR